MKAENVAACEAAKESVWLRKFLTDLKGVPNMHLPVTLYCDNSGAVQIQNNQEAISEENILSANIIS